MLQLLRHHYRQWWLKRHPIEDALWQPLSTMPILRGLDEGEMKRLRELAAWFLRTKTITPVAGIELSDPMRVILAMQACLPILNLGFDAYDDWHEVIIYPSQFISQTRERDLSGLVHEGEQILAGQARSDGPVLLSWHDVMESPWLDGFNVVIHELAHKLDMRNGYPNGEPPLHYGMNRDDWKAAFQAAYQDLQWRANAGHPSEIDLYAATDPAECFAVLSEMFFESPQILNANYPQVYRQLQLFYRQDPIARLSRVRYRPVSDLEAFAAV
ncbi:zinc-dependent peptidase [Chitinibacter sp. ZOR0017]|uniref:M90 family metallopeptidase n=1 Tax=Chitinibacter sp. ZOR0017 TaxID=1339254 RepID=UPI0009DF832B|nr:M90 family metallopeptidase [Chitinibacter sp. ZOR0017]